MNTVLNPFNRRNAVPVLVTIFVVSFCLTPIDIPVCARGIVRPQGDPIRIISEIGGRIRNIYVREGSEVQAGSLLVQLDSRGLLLKKRAIESRIHLTELRLSSLDRAGLAGLYGDLEQTRLNLGRLTITSPADGSITSLASLQTGQTISAGIPIATLVPRTDDLVIESWLPLSDRTYVTPGQHVRLHTDSLPPDQYNTLAGTVLSISPDARVLISPAPYSPELHLGLTFNVHFTTRQERLLLRLFQKLRSQFDLKG